MAQIITVEAADVWGYFQKLRPSPGIMRQLAENPAYGVEIYLTTDATHEGQFLPKILVYLDDDLIHSEICISDADCEHTVASAYERYLSDEVLSLYLDSMEEEYEAMNCDREIEYREADLDAAVYDFLTAVFEDSVDSVFPDMEEADEICADFKEHALEYLARKHELEIRRPMYMEDDDGNISYEEYPYSCMAYDDEDNPIYQ